MRSTRRSVYLVIASWMIAVLFASPTIGAMVENICVMNASEGGVIIEQILICYYCYYCSIVLCATDFIPFVIVLIVNIVLYSLIVRRVGKSFFSETDGLERTKSKKRRNSVAKMLIVNGIVFFVCLTPFSIFGLVLFLLNSALNPLIDSVTNPRYRLAFKKAFRLSRSHKASRSMVSTLGTHDQRSSATKMSQM